ncbi:MAG: hypothetical protein IKD39_03935 [Oscillospiraceae bacterium]|nr:hypothetical protein [Oscillospiraceae bacterium]MBR3962646.1 hypothetical protein [Oscillospiraceae bacterium]
MKKEVFLKALAAVLSFLFLWFSAGLIDYMAAVCFYREPVFCIKNGDKKGGFYRGLGYSYVISGNFDKKSSEKPFGAEYIEFNVFGERIETLIRSEEREEK